MENLTMELNEKSSKARASSAYWDAGAQNGELKALIEGLYGTAFENTRKMCSG